MYVWNKTLICIKIRTLEVFVVDINLAENCFKTNNSEYNNTTRMYFFQLIFQLIFLTIELAIFTSTYVLRTLPGSRFRDNIKDKRKIQVLCII